MRDSSIPSLFFYHKKAIVAFAIIRTNPFRTRFEVDQKLSSLFFNFNYAACPSQRSRNSCVLENYCGPP